MIRHLVTVRFQARTTAAAKSAIFGKLDDLATQLNGVLDFQSRANISVEDHLVRGFLDLFWFDFVDEAARDAYLIDATHQAIGAELVAMADGGLDGLNVVDFTV